MSEDVDVSVAGAQLEIGITLTVPAIQKFFDVIVVITQGEAIRIIQGVRSPIAPHLHCFTVTSRRFHAPFALLTTSTSALPFRADVPHADDRGRQRRT